MSIREEILVFCGPMRSGKSNSLLLHIDKLRYSNTPYVLFKPDIDSRIEGSVFTRYLKHSEIAFEIDVKDPWQMVKKIDEMQITLPFTVVIDEAQFFDSSIVDVVWKLNSMGINIVIGGLDLDASAKPFGAMGTLLAIATKVKKLTAVCEMCHAESTKTGLRKSCSDFDKNNVKIESLGTQGSSLYISLCTKCFRKNEKELFLDK